MPPTRTARLRRPSFTPTLSRDPRQGIANRPRPGRVIWASWQKKVGGRAGARLDLSSVCAGRWLRAPLQGLPPAGGTYLDPLLRLRKSRLGGRLRLQRLKSFQTQSGTSHLRSPACTRALGRRDEDGRRRRRRRRRSALPAPSSPPAPPSPPRPAPARRRSRRREARCRRTPLQLLPAPPGLRRAPSPQRERAWRRRELPLSPPSLAAPPPPPGGGCQLPSKNNRE